MMIYFFYDRILNKQLLFHIMQLFLKHAFLLVLKYLFENSCLTMEKVNINAF
jgi:hypothetical protein